MTKRILCVLLAVLMLFGLATVIGCGSQTDGPKETESAKTVDPQETKDSGQETEPEAEERIKSSIPETYDFNNEVISIAGWDPGDWEGMARAIRDVISLGPNGDLINDAIFDRNNMVEENYKVKFEYDSIEYVALMNQINNNVMSGLHVWDYTFPLTEVLGQIITKGSFTNLFAVPNMDWTKPWYDQSAIEYLSIAGSYDSNGVLFAVPTAASINDKDGTAAIAFNLEAAQTYGLPDLYDEVLKGRWTIDYLEYLCEGIYVDLNSNDQRDPDDFYGFLGKNDVAPSFKDGANSMIITKDEDGFLEFTLGSEYDIEVSEVILDFMGADFFFNHHIAGINDAEFTNMFAQGQGLFFWMRMDEVTNLRSSATDFGILPIPKYTESQEYYQSYVSKNTSSLLSIPLTNTGDRLFMTGMIIEALASDSLYSLQPKYIDEALGTKYARDEKSREMIHLIMEHRVFDPGMIYQFFANTYLNLYTQKVGLKTLIAQNEKSINAQVQKFNEDVLKIIEELEG